MKIDEIFKFDSTLEQIHSVENKSFHRIGNARTIEDGCIIFASNPKFWKGISELSFKNTGLIFSDKVFEKIDESKKEQLKADCFLIATSVDAELSMTLMSKYFYDKNKETWNDEVDGRQMGTAIIDPTCRIANDVFIGKNVVIGKNTRIYPGVRILSNSFVGDECEIYPGVTIYQDVKIGNKVRIHANTVIGTDGFGYNFREGVHEKVWHVGGVTIDDNVEIGANSCVDAGTFSPTLIGAGSKLDNHVQVGHNSVLGKGIILCGHVAVSGSAEIGDFSVFAGKSGIGPSSKIGKACQIAGGALVNRDWPDGSILGGHPARPLKEWMKGLAYVRNQLSER